MTIPHTSEARLELDLTLLTLEGAIDGLLALRATETDRALDRAVFAAYRDLVETYCQLVHVIDSRVDLRWPADDTLPHSSIQQGA